MHRLRLGAILVTLLAVAGCSDQGSDVTRPDIADPSGQNSDDPTLGTSQPESTDTNNDTDTDPAPVGVEPGPEPEPSGEITDTDSDDGQPEVVDPDSGSDADPTPDHSGPAEDEPSGAEPVFEPEVVVPPVSGQLGSPANLQVEIVGNSIGVSWQPVAGAEDYSVIWRIAGTVFTNKIFTSGIAQWQIGNLQSGATYDIWIAAIDTNGLTGVSTIPMKVTLESSATTSDMGP